MEIPLFRLFRALGKGREIQTGEKVIIIARQTASIEIPVKSSLLQDLNFHGVVTNFQLDQNITCPVVSVAFITDTYSTTEIDGFLCISGVQKLAEEVVSGDGYFVKLRVGIDSIRRASSCLLTSNQSSYFYVLSHNCDGQELLHPLNLTPKGLSSLSTAENSRNDFNARWFNKNQSDWEVTVSFALLFNSIKGPDPYVTDHLEVFREMLGDERFADTTIVADNETEIKCHRSVLGVRSSVFAAEFQKDMKETRSGILEMPNMSEESVRALLKYLYVWETGAAEENASVCLDLLEAGHKYDIETLEKAMERILLKKPEEWYTPHVILRLFFFVKNAELEELKPRVVKLFKAKYNEILKLPEFQDMRKKNIGAMVELLDYFVTSCSLSELLELFGTWIL